MAILDELVTQIENPDLRARIAAEVEKLAKQKKFGLVFEEHLPECTPLWDRRKPWQSTLHRSRWIQI